MPQPSNDNALLQEQVYALQTQNALLEEKSNDSSGESQEEVVPQPPVAEEAELTIETREPETLPTEPVMAGTSINYQNWSLIVSRDIKVTNSGNIIITIYVKNLSKDDKIFRFTNSAVTLKDNLGNVFPHTFEYSHCEKVFDEVKNLTIKGEGSATIKSDRYYCENSNQIDSYVGPIPIEASQLIVHFENFGPFSGVNVIIDL
jgi:hypothetical protein